MSDEFFYADSAECDTCGHRNDEHVSILGCQHDAATKESGGVDYSCGCDGFVPAAMDDSNEPTRAEARSGA